MKKTTHLVVYVTAPAGARSVRLARKILESRTGACVNVIPGIRSFFRWKGRVADEREDLLVIKTARGKLSALERTVRAAHPYDVPEIIALPIRAGHGPYLSWISAETKK